MSTRLLTPDLSPNAERSDILFAAQQLANPLAWKKWKQGDGSQQLERYFQEHYSTQSVLCVDSGRTALYAILAALQLNGGDVFLQAFTCVVVPNAIIAAGGHPQYIDIDRTYNIDTADLEKKIMQSKTPLAVIVQHTFGQPADIQKITELCVQHKLYLIEDCAHSLGAQVNGQLVGTFGDAAMFSFGRDKVISSVSGGVAITHNTQVAQHFEILRNTLPLPSRIWIMQRLWHPLVFSVGKKLYTIASIGKVIIHFAKKMHLVPLVVEQQEKQGQQQPGTLLPAVLRTWIMLQLKRLDTMNAHRKSLAHIYSDEFHNTPAVTMQEHSQNTAPIWLRFGLSVLNPKKLRQNLLKSGVLLGNWYWNPVDPAGVSPQDVHYTPGSCQQAEKLSKHIVNLPTNILTTEKDARTIAELVKKNI